MLLRLCGDAETSLLFEHAIITSCRSIETTQLGRDNGKLQIFASLSF
jgi:hypothetical protein